LTATKAELERVLRDAGDALRAGAGAVDFSQLLYTPDLVVVGEGWPRAIRGVEAFLPDLAALIEGWGPNADLTFTIVDPVFGDGDAATTLVDVYVAPRRPTASAEYYRVVYAWKRTAAGWRVAAEMYTVGSF
jgi:ketosteroid isomerase-like protein